MQDYKGYALSLEANQDVIYWIEHNLANYLKTNPEDQEQIEHIIDYLVSSDVPNNIPSISYQDAVKNTEKWVKKLINKGEHIKELPTDTEVVLDFKDGFKIVKLIGKNAYEREGYLMRHCVASYFGNSKEIYSLRDENNMPHCTMERDQQVKGRGNGNIHPKYVGYVVKFLEFTGMTVGDSEMAHLGYINVEKFSKYLSKETKYFNKKYVPDSEKLLNQEGNEFASLDLLDVRPLIQEDLEGAIKINFELPVFIKLSVDFLFKYSKKTTTLTQAASGHSSQLAASGDSSQLAASGDYSKLAASGYYSKLAASGYYSKLAASGYYSKLAASGYYSKLAASGYSSQLAASGDSSQLAASGDSSKLAASGDSSELAASGDYSKLAASGDYSELAASGDSSKLAASGDSSQLEMTGKDSVGANIGIKGKIKGKIGDWITLAEYNQNNKPICVKSAQIDGKKIKEDIWYELVNQKFEEVK